MDYQELRAALLRKGQAEEDTKRDHSFFFIVVAGKKERATKLSHGERGQINNELLSLIARQMRLKREELQDFVDCTLGREDWLRLWLVRPGLWR